MEKIFITTQTGQKVEVGVVRLFKHNETVFFIYTLSEKDANNYVKLYVTKVNMSNLQSVVISDENEWASFKEIMKDIIKNNRNNIAVEIIDLDPKTIQNITVYDPKVFKLSEEMTNFLQMNIKLANTISEVAPVEPQSTVPDVFSSVAPTSEVAESPIINEPVVDVSSLSGDISANPEPAMAANESSEINIESTINNDSVMDSSSTQLVESEISVAPVETPMAVENVVDSNGATNNDNTAQGTEDVDYRVAYLEEQLKVETLNTKIATLEAQIKCLEQKIDQIKNIVE